MARTSPTAAKRRRPSAPLKATALRRDLYRVLDRVVETGEPALVERNGRLLRIVAASRARDLDELPERPDLIAGDPDELVHLDWSTEWKP